jgi:negative regulator of sigma E activity
MSRDLTGQIYKMITKRDLRKVAPVMYSDGVFLLDTYVHTQSVASNSWVVIHNLNKYPAVSVVDSSNRLVVGDVTYDTVNQVTIEFSAAFAGKAYFN